MNPPDGWEFRERRSITRDTITLEAWPLAHTSCPKCESTAVIVGEHRREAQAAILSLEAPDPMTDTGLHFEGRRCSMCLTRWDRIWVPSERACKILLFGACTVCGAETSVRCVACSLSAPSFHCMTCGQKHQEAVHPRKSVQGLTNLLPPKVGA